MNTLLLASAVIASLVSVQGQSSCVTPNGVLGKCVSLFDCLPLLDNARNRNVAGLDFLQRSTCGSIGTTLAVCCPAQEVQIPQNNCYTPDNTPGKCVNINLCKFLVDLLVPPVSQSTLYHIKALRCNGTSQYSVCCAPRPTLDRSPDQYSCTASPYPPDPTSGCCGIDSRVGSRIDYTAPTPMQYPWLAILEYEANNRRYSRCGGALISGRYVLTSAYCAIGVTQPDDIPNTVILGEYDKSSNGPDCARVETDRDVCTNGELRIPIEKIDLHPNIDLNNWQRGPNVALIRLQDMAPYTEFIRPVCLPTFDLTSSLPPNFLLYVAGWGLLKRDETYNIKSHVDLPFIRGEECQRSYLVYNQSDTQIGPVQFCAGRLNGGYSCLGHRGMPLMYNNGRTYEAIGVSGHETYLTCFENTPRVYTKVSEYIDWIQNSIQP